MCPCCVATRGSLAVAWMPKSPSANDLLLLCNTETFRRSFRKMARPLAEKSPCHPAQRHVRSARSCISVDPAGITARWHPTGMPRLFRDRFPAVRCRDRRLMAHIPSECLNKRSPRTAPNSTRSKPPMRARAKFNSFLFACGRCDRRAQADSPGWGLKY